MKTMMLLAGGMILAAVCVVSAAENAVISVPGVEIRADGSIATPGVEIGPNSKILELADAVKKVVVTGDNNSISFPNRDALIEDSGKNNVFHKG